MTHIFDPGYSQQPFKALVGSYPGASVYHAKDFRIEWGPLFHRGRLDGSARILLIGQDPAVEEAITRRILVGGAGHRIQGFLAKLGFARQYVMVNTFLYSLAQQQGGKTHVSDASIAAYRHQWLDALFAGSNVEAVVALGSLAHTAWQEYRATASGAALTVTYQHITHPTQPVSASHHSETLLKSLTKTMLHEWNAALDVLKASIVHPESSIALKHYGDDFLATELVEIPEEDLPPGLPDWMRSADVWGSRVSADGSTRAAIQVTIPPSGRLWTT